MVTTGLQNNQLFPGIALSLLITFLSLVINIALSSFTSSQAMDTPANGLITIFVAAPLLVAVWGATLFSTGKGFTAAANAAALKEQQL